MITENQLKVLTEIERTSTAKEKTGVPIGAYAINPVNNEKVPVWTADYVLGTYGTGCVMAVPAHDERDFEFAKKFNLPIKKVIMPEEAQEEDPINSAYVDEGIMISSGKYTGLNSADGIIKITEDLQQENKGAAKVNYKLRDWLISRQRYWGTPIPIIHCPDCGEVPVEEKDLPVVLPYEVEFKPTGESPLAANKDFINTPCPHCGKDAKRDPDTMDTFVDSSWYYFRYLDPHKQDAIFNKELADKWVPVDMYVGGAEHATMHLLYARFIHKFLRDIGLTNSDEPFQHLVHQGTITHQGAKMSKTKGNVVNPDEFTKYYGSDVFRLYLMFMGPYEMGGDWSDKGIAGTDRFVQRTYEIFNKYAGVLHGSQVKEKLDLNSLSADEKLLYKKINKTIKKYDEEMNNFRFNTAIASLMELLNEMGRFLDNSSHDLKIFTLRRFALMLAPIAPHLGEECWQMAGNEKSIFQNPVWFDPDAEALVEDEATIAVQVNGKLRSTIVVAAGSDQASVKTAALSDDKVSKYLENKVIVKEIFVQNKIYNIVVK